MSELCEGDSMKLMRIALSLALLFTGCYTNTAVTKDTVEVDGVRVDDANLIFRLKDRSYITSKGGQHHRVEDGYEVTGTHVRGEYYGSSKDVSIELLDEQISEVVSAEMDVLPTIVGLAFLGGIVAVLVLSIRGCENP